MTETTIRKRRSGPRAAAFLLWLLGLASWGFSDLSPLALGPAGQAPVLDGKLAEGEWAEAFKLTDFKTFQPDFNKDPSQKTVGYFLYDADNLYFAFRCYDTEPSKIKASLSKRDAMFQDDFVGIVFDTYNTMQGGYAFLVNPLGIQGDGMMDIQGNVSDAQDFLWHCKGAIDEQGYVIEARIPLQSIRFPAGKTITMRLAFFRQLVRTSEVASAPPIFPDKGAILAQTQVVTVSGLRFRRVVELLPAVTASRRLSAADGRLQRDESLTELGLTGKVGISNDLTLDAAVNPDFSQVESDAGQVDINLRYALYFPEKRPFFLEGSEIFQLAGNTEEAPLLSLVHTRRIVDPVAGFKLSGKMGVRNTFAALYALDGEPYGDTGLEPSFSIFRLKHALKDDSYLGAYYTGRDIRGGSNRVGGVDGRFRLGPTDIFTFHLLGSLSKDGAGGAEPGHALGLAYEHDDRKSTVILGYQDISKDFQVDTGFLERTGLRRLAAFGMYKIYPKSKLFQRIEPFYWSYHLLDTDSDKVESFNLFTLRFHLPRSTQVRFDAVLASEVYEGLSFGRSGLGLQARTQISKHLFINLFFRHTGAIYYDPEAPYQGDGNRAQAYLEFQPTDQLDFVLSLAYQDFTRRSDKSKIYDYTLIRSFNTFQINKYLFLRGIVEYNFYYKRMTVDALASFTYIPGTVIYVGYGSALERVRWDGEAYVGADRFLETKRGFFFKVSYLWRI
jgi:hypothetical protein